MAKDFYLPLRHKVKIADFSIFPVASWRHYTLVVANVRGSELVMRHYDSRPSTVFKEVNWPRDVAATVMSGLQRLLEAEGKVYTRVDIDLDARPPHQYDDNVCKEDGNTCGSFVWRLAQYFVRNIVR